MEYDNSIWFTKPKTSQQNQSQLIQQPQIQKSKRNVLAQLSFDLNLVELMIDLACFYSMR